MVNRNETTDNTTDYANITEMFGVVAMVDEKLEALNTKMCTTTCPCEGELNNTGYNNYQEETFNKFGRTKTEKEHFKELQFGSMVESHKTVLECLDKGKSIAKGIDDYAVPSVPFTEYKITWVKDSINYLSSDGLDKI